MIIIVGSDEDFHSKYIFETLKNQNIDAKYFDSRQYPSFGFYPDSENSYIVLDGEKISVRDIQSVYFRWYYGIARDKYDIIFREKVAALESFLASLEPISWNSLQAIELHRKKGFQLNIMSKNGIRIPKTLITNDKDILSQFYLDNNKQIIYKPVRSGAYTKVFTEQDLLRANALANCPCQFQELVSGVDISVHAFISGEVFAGKITSNNIDFRADKNASLSKFELPDKVQRDCLKVLELLGLKYSRIDMRLSNEGEFVFFEANPAPVFYDFEQATKYPITQTLIKNLIKE
jgi:glutathione synthase/RimK-type ligase-like ATP-grasp enzyme